MKLIVSLGCVFLVAVTPLYAVIHVIPGTYPHAHQDQMHHPNAAQIRATGSVKAALASGSSGTKNIAVILVQFPVGNAALISGSNSVLDVSKIQTHFNQMQSYYTEVSHSQILVNFSYFNSNTASPSGDANPSVSQAGVYTMGLPEESYGCGDEGTGCTSVTLPTGASSGANGNYLTRDALVLARAGHSNLDSSHFDAVIIVHAGNGNESTLGTPGDIWSIFYADDPGSPVIGSAGGGFSEGDVVPETELGGFGCPTLSPLGVMCHEFGHSLGLPDLYNTSAEGGTSVVGKWELMDAGPYDGCGANPSHMGVWDKTTLGWFTPTLATNRLSTTLNYIETNPSALKIPIENGLPEEYFLVEYRSNAAPGALYDQGIPGTGLLIWHIDDAITSSRGIDATGNNAQNTVNTGSPHYGVSIVAADGSNVGQTGGAATNMYSNESVFTTPQSDNFSAQPSGISVVNISGVGGNVVTLQVANLAVTAGQGITKVINFPNPAGKGYAHPSGQWHTTFQMQATRPASDYQLNIYTLSGDLVRKIGKDEITLNIERSSDDKWVYEYIWDLKNGDGSMVAPGTYLYLFRADGQNKSDKIVVIR